ncbi:uncharacterized protein KY384_004900 [Bacidia gigantensis]|uniref:uncharacterized protein n=1 Tax=Bacidia gigantensis TaxID=2732470 RepID=UPI001D04A55A|nr:uncharacterized protein KY384_004900 [Bacidia gigantensis]KAG8530398.1 hypothetical protein KY384_004900 [Bacidia gigantensis]
MDRHSIVLKSYQLCRKSTVGGAEYQHALEVVFDVEEAKRRRSSLANPDASNNTRLSSNERRQKTACFVHSLLGKERVSHTSTRNQPKDLDVDSKMDKSMGNERLSQRSRMLTKRELSDMAWGVRELSKQLASVKLRLKGQTIFILTKVHDVTLIDKTREMVEWLLSKERNASYVVYVEITLEHNPIFNAKGLVPKDPSRAGRLKYWTNDLAAKHPLTFDLVITLGGDGTLLYASWLFQQIVPPVISFSLGSLGFLTKFDFALFRDTLANAFKDGVTVSLRLRFEGTVMRSQHKGQSHRDLVEELVGEEADNDFTHRAEGTFEILNDIVVDRGPNPTMSALEIFGDDEHFTTVQADGVCVATPTGSTAYNLAAGGSLCHPENPVILVTAICAHTLSFRPVILPDTIVLRVGVPYDARTGSWASFDGRERVELFPGDYVTISASRYPFANVMQPGRRSEDWVSSISRTLNWNSRQKQKAFKES